MVSWAGPKRLPLTAQIGPAQAINKSNKNSKQQQRFRPRARRRRTNTAPGRVASLLVPVPEHRSPWLLLPPTDRLAASRQWKTQSPSSRTAPWTPRCAPWPGRPRASAGTPSAASTATSTTSPPWTVRVRSSNKKKIGCRACHIDAAPAVYMADDGPGSLREGCRRREPLWIVFDVSGTIQLSSGVRVSSYKTIDGRGQRVRVSGWGLQLSEVEHVIVCALEVVGGRGHDADAVQIKPRSRHVWVDRCTLRDFQDGLVDVTGGSTDVTISRCHLASHDKAVLIGASSAHVEDRCIRVTIHHCFFDSTRQRHPRVRFGRVHLYNNYTRDWGIYAVCASVEAQVIKTVS